MHWTAPITMALLLACGAAQAAPKTDVVTLRNGDRLTGEIKKLERGLLELSTDALGTVRIEWPEVVEVRTRQLLEVTGSDGHRSHGRIAGGDASGGIVLELADGRQSLLVHDAVVHIVPLSEGRVWDRIDGHASVGLSAASANDNRQVTVSADIAYRDAEHSLDADYSGARTESANNPLSERHDLKALYRWFPGERRFWGALGSVTSNDELDLRLRTLVGVGTGRHWLRESDRELWAMAGLVATREDYRGSGQQDSVEAVLQGSFDLFRFDDPELDLSATLALYPSLSVSGRVRSELSLRARIELVKDLYYELSYLRSQDNKPPGGVDRQIDWSLVSSVGYKF